VLHVIASGLPPELEAEQQRSAESFLAGRLRHISPEGAAGCASIVLTGNVFSTIIAEAMARAADLIVIGKPGNHRYADLFTGTTAERVIRFSDRPVLMVKQPASEHYRRVLVAFDGSEGVVRAFQMALAIAPDAEFRVVHAWWSPHVSLGEIEAVRQEIHDENKRLKELIANAARQAVTASGAAARVTIDLVENNPYMVVANQSSWADLLVLGTHSKGRLASTVSIGRLARHLLIESSCDVLTSRP
jgi:nucleotide-binding universal stress UspA family protein